jgi:mono/diheme cytochrome c family protein
MRTLALCSLFGVSALLAGCGGAKPAVEKARGTPPPPAQACARRHPNVGATRASAGREGSSVALARLGRASLAYVADEDTRALHTLDLDRKTEAAVTPLLGAPAQVLVLADGRVAVTLRDQNRVQILEPTASAQAPLDTLCSVDVPTEPVALAATPDDQRLLVTSAWARTLTALDATSMKPVFDVKLEREPRAVVVDDSGERAFVAHVVGATMSVVDLTGDKHAVRPLDLRVTKVMNGISRTPADKLRGGCQGFALAKSVEVIDKAPPPPVLAGEQPEARGKAVRPPAVPQPRARIFAPMVTVDAGDPEVRSQAYYGGMFEGVAKEAPIVSVVDADAERPMTRSVLSLSSAPMSEECLLPRAAAVRGSSGTLFVTCLGIDSLVELDTRGLDPARLELRRWSVPAGPTGLAIDDRKDGGEGGESGDRGDRGARAVVWSQFEHKLSIIPLDSPGAGKPQWPEDPYRSPTVISVRFEPDAATAQVLAGRRLFHATDDRRISGDGSACASCHPDGREDALTWSTPEGPRQTIMLAGRVEATAPYGWIGKHDTLKTYVHNTFTRLGGAGLGERELDALLAYVRAMPGPRPSAWAPRNAAEAKLVDHGRELFFASEQGCAGCHVGGPATDQSRHDIGSKATADDTVEFDTPALHLLSGTAPYFHDGRYATLDALLSASDSKMGHTMHLSKRDAAALKAYLETL